MKITSFVICFFLSLTFADDLRADNDMANEKPGRSQSHEERKADAMSHKDHERMTEKAMSRPMEERKVGVEEKLGLAVPQNIFLTDENGASIALGALLDKPVILLPVFYSCARVCGLQTAYLAEALKSQDTFRQGEYRIISFSFDAEDTPKISRRMKKNYFPMIGENFSENDWRFLTGDQKSIDQLLSAIGYQVQKAGPGFFFTPQRHSCPGSRRKSYSLSLRAQIHGL